MVQRYTSNDFGVTLSADGALKPLSSLETIWDAREQLSLLSNLTSQRTYSALASGGRHMLTWLDINNNQQVDDGEQLPFMPSTFTGNEGYLGISASEVATVVNYVRGEELTGTRSRTIDFDEDGIDDVWRLGDIVHSTPDWWLHRTVVMTPITTTAAIKPSAINTLTVGMFSTLEPMTA